MHVYIALTPIQDYVSQENAWSSNGSTCQHATSNIFTGYMHKSIYISTDFQISEGLRRGPEFSHNYTIDYVIITYIVITAKSELLLGM